MGAGFDFDATFDEDYLYFYEPPLAAKSDAEAELIARLLRLSPGAEVLDIACGHGRIANRLAARGFAVTGIDRTALFLEQARGDARAAGVEVEYVEGDMRSLPWTERFDGAVSWFTSWGYFDDAENQLALAEMYRALRPGGRLLLEHLHRDNLMRRFQRDVVTERDGNYVIDRHELDVATGRVLDERIVVRDGRVRRFTYFVRLVSFTELRDWLLAVGFEAVEGYDGSGQPLTLESPRMIAVATK